MKSLEEKILNEGKIMPGHILNIGSFLNQQIDTCFLMEMGKEVASLYKDSGVTKVLTIESSGIALAVASAAELKVPVLFAKKHRSGNVAGEVYKANIHSYTHGNDYEAVVPASFLCADDKVLLVDDFLASGEALNGLIDLVGQANATVVGAAIAVEKGFQKGGDTLREKGMRVESLAIIDKFLDDTVEFRKQF